MLLLLSKLRRSLSKILNQKLTILLIPHNVTRPFRMQFSFAFVLFLVFLWTGVTSWAAMAVFSNVDYWSVKADHEILKLKVSLFSKELRKSREYLDQVKEADEQLRKMIQLKGEKKLISSSDEGQGGPQPYEQSLLAKTLNMRLWDVTPSEIHQEVSAITKESQERLASYKEITQHVAYQRAMFRSAPRGWPAEGHISSRFGERVSPTHGGPQFHTGIDIANFSGTPVRATGDGLVVHASWEGGYGRLVSIDHGFGFLTHYGHNNRLVVKEGDRVKRGQVIAYMGSSGASTGNHLHYEIWLNGRYVNPARYLFSRR